MEDDTDECPKIKNPISKRKNLNVGGKQDVFSRLYNSSKRKNGAVSKFAAPRMARSLRGSPAKPKFSFGGAKNLISAMPKSSLFRKKKSRVHKLKNRVPISFRMGKKSSQSNISFKESLVIKSKVPRSNKASPNLSLLNKKIISQQITTPAQI